jgi:hypothetical protein
MTHLTAAFEVLPSLTKCYFHRPSQRLITMHLLYNLP